MSVPSEAWWGVLVMLLVVGKTYVALRRVILAVLVELVVLIGHEAKGFVTTY